MMLKVRLSCSCIGNCLECGNASRIVLSSASVGHMLEILFIRILLYLYQIHCRGLSGHIHCPIYIFLNLKLKAILPSSFRRHTFKCFVPTQNDSTGKHLKGIKMMTSIRFLRLRCIHLFFHTYRGLGSMYFFN